MGGGASVLITDAEYISALSAVRSLGKAGYRVIAVSRSRLAHSFYSRYCAARYRVCDPKVSSERFLREIGEIYRREGCSVLVPVYLHAIRSLVGLSDGRFNVLLPRPDSFDIAERKAEFIRWADGRGYPVPRFLIWNGEEGVVELCERHELEPPLVVKASIGEGAREVRYVDDWEALGKVLCELADSKPLLVQRRIFGVGYGVSCLFGRDGRLIARFVHKRLREIPPTGGASVYRESVRWDELAELGTSILRDLSWRGLAMVEFKVDEAGDPYLMEINPRFWGSLPLAVASGVDFPRLYVEEALGLKPGQVVDYPTGVRAHRLLFAGIYVLPYYVFRGGHPIRALVETFAFWNKRYHEDIFSATDPLPAVVRFIYTCAELLRKVGRRLGLVKG